MPYQETDFAEFITRDRGVAEWPKLTIELATSYSPAFNDAFKAMFSHGIDRAWDPTLKRWLLSPDARDRAVELAKQYYRSVYVTEGEDTTEVVSGRKYNAPKLF